MFFALLNCLFLSITSAQVHFSQVFAIIFVLSDCYYCTHCGKLQTLVISIIRLAIKPLSHKISHKSYGSRPHFSMHEDIPAAVV